MATNILTTYLNEGFNEGFFSDLIDYIKKTNLKQNQFHETL